MYREENNDHASPLESPTDTLEDKNQEEIKLDY